MLFTHNFFRNNYFPRGGGEEGVRKNNLDQTRPPPRQPLCKFNCMYLTKFYSLSLFHTLNRFASCPSKLGFWKDVKNLVDVTALLPYYVTFINVVYTMNCASAKSSASLAFLRVVRLVRIFKLTKHSVGLQVCVLCTTGLHECVLCTTGLHVCVLCTTGLQLCVLCSIGFQL